jgi:hypothetical protein
LQVKWEDRLLDFNITTATNYSSWLNINRINRFINDFDPAYPTKLSIVVRGAVRELCPAAWLFGADGTIMCEYALHGSQGNQTCCPHGITGSMPEPKDCGCRDDLEGTPYRLGYQLAAVGDNQTMFNFDLAKVDPSTSVDFDGSPDKEFGADALCTNMTIHTIAFVVRADVEIQDIIFNGYNYTWQYEAYTDGNKWLKVLDIAYSASDVSAIKMIPLQVLVKGIVRELCPAASQFSSQASCEYIIYGSAGDSRCCPLGVTSWSIPSVPSSSR